MTIFSLLLSRNLHHLGVQISGVLKNKQSNNKPIWKSTYLLHHSTWNGRIMTFWRGRSKEGRIFPTSIIYTLPALLRNTLTSLLSLKSPLDATNQPCHDVASCQVRRSPCHSVSNMPTVKTSLTCSHSSSSDKEGGKRTDKVSFRKGHFYYSKVYSR